MIQSLPVPPFIYHPIALYPSYIAQYPLSSNLLLSLPILFQSPTVLHPHIQSHIAQYSLFSSLLLPCTPSHPTSYCPVPLPIQYPIALYALSASVPSLVQPPVDNCPVPPPHTASYCPIWHPHTASYFLVPHPHHSLFWSCHMPLYDPLKSCDRCFYAQLPACTAWYGELHGHVYSLRHSTHDMVDMHAPTLVNHAKS